MLSFGGLKTLLESDELVIEEIELFRAVMKCVNNVINKTYGKYGDNCTVLL
jgi:hypothetical protein